MTVRAGAYATCMRRTKYTREVLEPVVRSSRSLAEVMRKLGLPTTGGNYRLMALHVRRNALDTSHFGQQTIRARIDGVPTEQLARLVAETTSFSEVLSRLGFASEGRPHEELRRRITALGLDVSHFTGRGWSRGKSWRSNESVARIRSKGRYADEDVFVENSPVYAGNALVPRLLEMGWQYQCAWCGVVEWRGERLVLHLDHANGIHNDNRLENLRLLCPNCHSQTKTYGNRRR
jgi:hypothetical protein